MHIIHIGFAWYSIVLQIHKIIWQNVYDHIKDWIFTWKSHVIYFVSIFKPRACFVFTSTNPEHVKHSLGRLKGGDEMNTHELYVLMFYHQSKINWRTWFQMFFCYYSFQFWLIIWYSRKIGSYLFQEFEAIKHIDIPIEHSSLYIHLSLNMF